MRLILTPAERHLLVDRSELEEALLAIALLGRGLREAAGFTCIHDPRPEEGQPGVLTYGGRRRVGGYCDDCPLAPRHDRSLPEAARSASRLFCDLPKEWSK
jgi:hypothetical protein